MKDFDPHYIPDNARFLLGVKVLVINEDGQVLLLKRSDKVTRPGGWDFPGGGVDMGESPDEAARREIKEETSLTVHKLQLVSTHLASTNGEDDLIIGYVGSVDSTVVELTAWEHDEFIWVKIDELNDEILPPEHMAVVDGYKGLIQR